MIASARQLMMKEMMKEITVIFQSFNLEIILILDRLEFMVLILL